MAPMSRWRVTIACFYSTQSLRAARTKPKSVTARILRILPFENSPPLSSTQNVPLLLLVISEVLRYVVVSALTSLGPRVI